ncbi:Nuclear pore complex protein NUP98A [Porphyridium purpureum]|uniref:Nuclear pore complex protein NUP98A n=1 Tax=Porphyridium purpureum TaxID=35688 RepID=A0A5J4YRB7_PORPP|nr:Nuclear pore complex protein NUP98A [Porphyridium purpureum]|eukprot:POR3403..scf222_8
MAVPVPAPAVGLGGLRTGRCLEEAPQGPRSSRRWAEACLARASRSAFGQPQQASAFGQPQQTSAFGQPQQGSAFGQPQQAPAFGGGFGNTGAGSAFGAAPAAGGGFFGAQPQQQQQASPFGAAPAGAGGGGLFGAQTAGPAGNPGGGGLFGAPQQPQQAFGGGGSLFGSAAQAQPQNAGGSLFGGGASTGFGAAPGINTSPFGAPALPGDAAKPLFGAPSSGGTGSLFGGGSGASPFGGGFGGGAGQGTGLGASSGTSSVKFQIQQEYDSSSGQSLRYHSICMMPAYKDKCCDELRYEDYLAGNKGGGVGGAFGTGAAAPGQQSSPFGSNAGAPAGGGLFGVGGGGFGGQQQPSAFGAAAPSAGTGAFGAKPPLFGGSPAQGMSFGNAAQGSAFGAPAGGAGTSLFGQPQQQQAGGLFGPTAQGGGLFGGTQQHGQQPSSSLFGGGTAGAASGSMFGSSNAGGGLFGGGTAQSQSAFGAPSGGTGGGLFGGGGFGAAAGGGAFGNKPAGTGGSLFGQPQQQQSGTGGFGLFGGAPGQSQSAFGGGATTMGGFGGGAQSGPSLFGANTGSAFGSSPGGGFGGLQQQQQQQQPATSAFGGGGGGGFGTSPFGGGTLGGQQQTQQQGAGGGLFGGGGAFGGTGGAGAGSLFGSKPATTGLGNGGSLFGAAAPQGSPNTNNGLYRVGTLGGGGLNLGTGGFGGAGGGLGGSGLGGGFGGLGQDANKQQPFNFSTGLGGGAGGGGLGGNNNLFGGSPQGGGAFGGGFGGGFGGLGGGNLGHALPMQQPQQPQPGAFWSPGGVGAGGAGVPPQSMFANVSMNPYGSNPLFANTQDGSASAIQAQQAGQGQAQGAFNPSAANGGQHVNPYQHPTFAYRRLPRTTARARPRTAVRPYVSARVWEEGYVRGSGVTATDSALVSSLFQPPATPMHVSSFGLSPQQKPFSSGSGFGFGGQQQKPQTTFSSPAAFSIGQFQHQHQQLPQQRFGANGSSPLGVNPFHPAYRALHTSGVKKLVINPQPPLSARSITTHHSDRDPLSEAPANPSPALEDAAEGGGSAARANAMNVSKSPSPSPQRDQRTGVLSVAGEVPAVKPTPRRRPGQFVGADVGGSTNMRSPDHAGGLSSAERQQSGSHSNRVYESYRDFYSENVYPLNDSTTGSVGGGNVSSVPVFDVEDEQERTGTGSRRDETTGTSSPSARAQESSQHESEPEPPVLTRAGYYTRPSMAALRSMTQAELARVEGFTVGRKAWGEVMWFGRTDVRGLDLDAIVFIEPREVVVYPDGYGEKPPEGAALNKPALVRLLRVWKLSKETGAPTTDPSAIKLFAKKLKAHCDKESITFVRYEGTEGLWEFEVEHFSRYGFDDEDDEEENAADQLEQEASGTQQRRARDRGEGRVDGEQLERRTFKSVSSYGIPAWSDESESEDEGDDERPRLPTSSAVDPAVVAVAAGAELDNSGRRFIGTPQILRSLEASRIQQMRAAMFTPAFAPSKPVQPDQGAFDIGQNVNREAPQSRTDMRRKKRQIQTGGSEVAVAWPESLPSEGDAEESMSMVTQTEAPISSGGVEQAPLPKPPTILLFQSRTVIPIRETIQFMPKGREQSNAHHDAYRLDAGYRMSRSFRIGFGTGGQLCSPRVSAPTHLFSGASSLTTQTQQQHRFQIQITRPALPTERDAYEAMLSVHASLWLESQELSVGRSVAANLTSAAEMKRPSLTGCFVGEGGLSSGPDAHNRRHLVRRANDALDTYARAAEQKSFRDAQYFSAVFQLLAAIYRQDSVEDSLVANIGHAQGALSVRRAQLASQRASAWLRKMALGNSLESSEFASILDRIFILLASGDVDQAANAALEHHAPHLALMLSQAAVAPGTAFAADTAAFAEQLRAQSDELEPLGDHVKQQQRMRDIVLLLSGQVDQVSGVLHLPWLSVLACHFWYGAGRSCVAKPQGAPLPVSDFSTCQQLCTAFEAYADLWPKCAEHVCAHPTPAYYEARDRANVGADAESPPKDVVYLILALYSGVGRGTLEAMLDPRCWGTRKNLMDYRLPWHAYQMLVAVTGARPALRAPVDIHENFAAQLENAGLMTWSLYVRAAGMEGSGTRGSAYAEAQFRSALQRLYPKLCTETVMVGRTERMRADVFLVDHLCVPQAWLFEAKALWQRYEMFDIREAQTRLALSQLLLQDRWSDATRAAELDLDLGLAALNEAHAVLARRVFPAVVAQIAQRQQPALRGQTKASGSALHSALPVLSGPSERAAVQKLSAQLEQVERLAGGRIDAIAAWSSLGRVFLFWLHLVDDAADHDAARRDLPRLHEMAQALLRTAVELRRGAPKAVDGSVALRDRAGVDVTLLVLADTVVALQRACTVRMREAIEINGADADAVDELKAATQLCADDLVALQDLTSTSLKLRLMGEYSFEEKFGDARRWFV